MEKNFNAIRLFLLGFLTLFLELVLIRYLPANIWNLGYFPNLVLLGVFVGMGLGFVFHRRLSPEKSDRIFRRVPLFLLALIVFIMAFRPVVPGFDQSGSGSVGGELYFTNSQEMTLIASFLLFFVWFFAIVCTFAMISQYTAKLFTKFEPLKAYTLDIAGSCAGILAFMAISWFQLPASFWFAVLIPLFLLTMNFKLTRQKWVVVGAMALAVALVFTEDAKFFQVWRGVPDNYAEFIWSPYQKVKYKAPTIFVNGINHQEIAENAEKLKSMFYQSPYTERASQKDLPPYKQVMIIGAGSGNDVATALLNGAEHVDAVEIDPAIAEVGKVHHPLKPYADPRVTLTINDGRAFLTKATHKYDLIVMALTDSLVKVSPMSQLRLENYLFTKDTVQRASSLLNEGGSLVFYNAYRKPWLIQKLQFLLTLGSGYPAHTIFDSGGFTVMKVTHSGAPATAEQMLAASSSSEFDMPSDDWPFLYLKHRGIPLMYIVAMICVSLLVLGMLFFLEANVKKSGENFSSSPGSRMLRGAFIFMGIAFLLLETKSVIQFSLLFGTTWINNSLVFFAILLSVLAANWTAWLIRKDSIIYVAFGLLMVSCLVALIYPISNLLYYDDKVVRFLLASLLTFSPIFFANLIFSVAFRKQAAAEYLFGWNLIGATLGGVIEYSSMAIGYHALTVLVTVCYIVAFGLLIRSRTLVGAGSTASRDVQFA